MNPLYSFIKLPSGKFINLATIAYVSALDGQGTGIDYIGSSNDEQFNTILKGDDARFLAGILDKLAETTMANLNIGDVSKEGAEA